MNFRWYTGYWPVGRMCYLVEDYSRPHNIPSLLSLKPVTGMIALQQNTSVCTEIQDIPQVVMSNGPLHLWGSLGTPRRQELVKVQLEVGAAQEKTDAEEDMAMDFQATVEELAMKELAMEELAVEEGTLKEKLASRARVDILETPQFA